jgi:lipopolysaccharide/colanic/teichoic acid biosynthesis glycosyltransferase
MKRLFDILFSLGAIIILSPFFILISILIKLDSGGKIFFVQKRVGKNLKEFSLLKFRTMKEGSEKSGMLTIGAKDNRITRIGFYLRNYKLDELPQFINVLIGDMSIVGPRPEVKKYVDLYTDEQKKILSVRPGITDVASLQFSDESATLSKYPDPEEAYVKEIMPAKLSLSLKYLEDRNLVTDIATVIKTAGKIFSSRHLENILLALLVFSLPLYEKASAWLAAAVVIVRVFDKNVWSDARQAIKNTLAVFMMAYFLLHVAGTFYSANLSYAWFDLQIKLPFLLFPLLLMIPLQKQGALRVLKKSFITGCTTVALLCLILGVISYSKSHDRFDFFYMQYSRFLHVTYFSMYLNLCILFLIHDIIICEDKKYQGLRLALLIFLFINVILLSARTALFTCFITAVFYSVMLSIEQKMLKKTYKAIALLLILLAATAWYGNRIYNRFEEVSEVLQGPKTEEKITPPSATGYNSVSIRVELWSASWELIKENILFGVGTGDIKDELEKKFTEKKFFYGAEKKFNPHNQFLHTGVMLGLAGGVLLILMLAVPAFQSLKNKNYLFVAFIAIVFLNCLTESILEVQKGVLFFCVFSLAILGARQQSD